MLLGFNHISWINRFASVCRDLGGPLSRLAVLCTQQRCLTVSGQTSALQVFQDFRPTQFAFPFAVMHRDELFMVLRRSSNDDQYARSIRG